MTNEMSQAGQISKPSLFTVSSKTLNVLAALVWYIGGFILLLKARTLLVEANALNPGLVWPWLALITGLTLGGLKAVFIFSRSCRRNITRITGLAEPKVWQFYRPRFFLLLAVMISAGASLSRMAHGSYPFLIGVAVLDLSISLALLGSSLIFWKHNAFR